jgi:hypothetical protein
MKHDSIWFEAAIARENAKLKPQPVEPLATPTPAPALPTETDAYGRRRLDPLQRFVGRVQTQWAGELWQAGGSSLQFSGAYVEALPETEKQYQQVEQSVALPAKEIEKINKWIRKGVRKILPSKLLARKFLGYTDTGREMFTETQVLDDLTAKVWVRLLADDTLTTKAGYNQARAAATDYLRQEAKFPLVESTSDPEDEESEGTEPWDRFAGFGGFEGDGRDCSEIACVLNDQALRTFKNERPDDYKFFVEYMASKRKASLKDRQRILTINRWLERRIKK